FSQSSIALAMGSGDIRTPAPTISLSLLAFFLWCGAVYLLHKAAPIAGRAALALLPFGLLLE
ncbi:hypothetical protein, partial [Morganella morganii]|uniref:hypothetical protein n=1 Tax=Morganella morganii TaxID=582 RepID=UPI001953EDEB